MKSFNQKQQKGISLVEIMVAMVISIFLLGGVIQVYIGNKTTYRFSDASARIQENARFALDTIASDMRMAGYWGCAQFLSTANNHLVNSLSFTTAQAPLYDYVNNDAISATEGTGLNGSDTLTVLGSKAGQNIIKTDMLTTEGDIEVSSSTNIKAEDIVIVSNCEGADIFSVSSVAAAGGGLTGIAHKTGTGPIANIISPKIDCTPAGSGHCLSQLYDTSSAISVLQAVTYSIQLGASGEPALWRSLNGVNEELIEGIEQMQVLFGIDQTGDGFPNQYVTSDNVADSATVGAIRLFLVVRSDNDQITDSAQIYNLNGVETTAPDNRLRQVFSITIRLRNRAAL